jgi:hypothetical protein
VPTRWDIPLRRTSVPPLWASSSSCPSSAAIAPRCGLRSAADNLLRQLHAAFPTNVRSASTSRATTIPRYGPLSKSMSRGSCTKLPALSSACRRARLNASRGLSLIFAAATDIRQSDSVLGLRGGRSRRGICHRISEQASQFEIGRIQTCESER